MRTYSKLLIVAVLYSPLVFGDITRDFRIAVATERENGDPLELSEIDRHRISCGNTAGGPYTLVFEPDFAGTSPQTVTSGPDFTAGNWFCVGQTVDTDGRISVFGGEVNFTVARCETSDCRPKPPALTVLF